MKRLVALMLCLVTSVSLLAGCAKDKDTSKKGANGEITLTIGIPMNANVTDYETNKFTLWLEETTGYNLEFETFSSVPADCQSQLATRIAGNQKLPDILWGFDLGEGSRSVFKDYGDSDYLIDLKPYFDDKEKSAVFWEQLEKAYPDETKRDYIVSRMTDTENGAMYAFPLIETTEIDTMQYQVFINQAWLDKLGLAAPTDNASLLSVLKAFKTKDPNGNGEKDEIPLLAINRNDNSMHGIGWLTSLFTGVDEEKFFNVDENGKVYMPQITDEYRQSLIFIKQLQDEGLLPQSCWNMSNADIKNLLNPTDSTNKVGIFVGHPTIVLEDGNKANYEYKALPLWSYAVENEDAFLPRYFITADCENPDAAWDLFMKCCSDEGAKRQRYGEKGVDWVEADAGTTSFIGKEADMKIINDIWGTQNNQVWGTVGATINLNAENESRQVSDDDDEWTKHKMQIMGDAYRYHEEAKAKYPLTTVPYILRTRSEADATTVERTNCANYINTMRTKFCCGTEGSDPSNDKQWQAYLDQLNGLGLQSWIKQTQEIYDRMTAQ